jgi:predicted benzoate:H+ symporter BenE
LPGAGIVIGAFFLLIGATGLVSRIARILPTTVAAGLQLGLGLSLAGLGVRLMEKQLWLGVVISAFMLLRLFTTIATLGTPRDVTLQEVRIEFFFPMDEPTAQTLRGWG